MINLKERLKELNNKNISALTLGCHIDNIEAKHGLKNCRSKDYQPSDCFIVKKNHTDITKYGENYIIKKSIIPEYVEITKKGRGECCPFYGFKCRFLLESIFREVYGENNYKI